MGAAELDAVARARIAEGGYGEHFGHGLGHGVGMMIHERPGVRPESADALEAGMAITIEPGIYLEGEGGVRIEDLVILSDEGSRGPVALPEGAADGQVRTMGDEQSMITTNDLKNGYVLDIDGELVSVVSFQHVKPGKGGAFVRTKLKNLTSGAVVDKTFRAGEKVERVTTESRTMQFLYRDGDDLHLMDNSTYEQIPVAASLVEQRRPARAEHRRAGAARRATRRSRWSCRRSWSSPSTRTDPGVKGDTVSNVTKPAEVETGATIDVPLFVNEGDRLKIDTRTREYSARA